MKLTALIIPTTHNVVTSPFSHGSLNIFIPVPLMNKSSDVITPTTDCEMNLIFGDNS
jgi:hypothetical protein